MQYNLIFYTKTIPIVYPEGSSTITNFNTHGLTMEFSNSNSKFWKNYDVYLANKEKWYNSIRLKNIPRTK